MNIAVMSVARNGETTNDRMIPSAGSFAAQVVLECCSWRHRVSLKKGPARREGDTYVTE